MNRSLWLVSAFVAAAISFPGASLADEYKWIGQKTEDGASLLYAIPESDAVQIGFYCDSKTRKITVSIEHEPVVAKDGVKIEVNLDLYGGGEGRSVTVVTTGKRLELDDKFILEGTTPLTANLLRILSGRGMLVLLIEDGNLEIPLDGLEAAARPLIAACTARRK